VDDLFATHDALAVAQLVKQRKLGARELLDGWPGCARSTRR
jgi:amidase